MINRSRRGLGRYSPEAAESPLDQRGLNVVAKDPYVEPMQTKNPYLDDFAKLGTAAMGLAQAMGDEAKAGFRAQVDRIASELDLIRREEFDALKAELAALRAEVAGLKAGKAAPAEPAAAKPAAPKTARAAPKAASKAAAAKPSTSSGKQAK